VLAAGSTFRLSVLVTGLSFFLVGASRSLVIDRRWYLTGGEMFLVGMVAAAVAYAAGVALGGFA
jgi:VIT1/CCC1 family predicted Fe2+/Mn2+ transporter